MTRPRWRTLVAVGLAAAAAAAVLVQVFGLRVVFTGGRVPTLQFVASAAEQAAIIERHRAAQRAAFARAGETGGAGRAAAPVTNGAEGRAAASLTAVPADVAVPRREAGALGAPPAAASPEGVVAQVQASWPEFRGPQRDGVYRGGSILTAWPAGGLVPLWTQPAGGGYASFAIANGRAFTIEQRAGREVLAAYDVRTGREVWTVAWEAEFRESLGGDGPRATPTWHDGTVYALGALGELRALEEASGRVRWRTNILVDAKAGNLSWGMAAAPLVVDDVVVVLPGGRSGQSVVAYDRRTGVRRWSALDDRASYASPMLVTLAGVRQLLVLTASRLVGLAVDGSRVLWEFPWPGPNEINAAQPLLIGGDRVFLSSGYGMGAAVLEVTGGDDGLRAREVWRSTRMKNRFASSVVHQGVVYGFDESILAAIDAATGEQMWKGGRYGYGQLLLAGDHLVVLAEDGDLALVRARRDRFDEVARFPVLDGKTWNVPALAGGVLLVRNLAGMAAFDLRAGPR